MKNTEYFDLVQPDIATIAYLKNGNVYLVYYDFKTQKYTEEDNVIEADQWPDTDIAKKVPKPDSRVIISWDFGSDELNVEAYDMSFEKYKAYIDKCKKMGFTLNAEGDKNDYSAENEEGYKLEVTWYSTNQSIDIDLSSPEE